LHLVLPEVCAVGWGIELMPSQFSHANAFNKDSPNKQLNGDAKDES